MSGIFVSYRRSDTGYVAKRLSEMVHVPIFRDIVSIGPGEGFEHVIVREIAESDVFVCLFGPHWRGETIGDTARIQLASDVFRSEIEVALSGQKAVIPVLVDLFAPPREDEIPGSLQPLLALNWSRVSMETAEADLSRLAGVLTQRVDEARMAAVGMPTLRMEQVFPARRFTPPERDDGRLADARPLSLVTFDAALTDAINVSITVQRPLVYIGPDSMVPFHVARGAAESLGWNLRTVAAGPQSHVRDLLYRYDSDRRLADAQAAMVAPNDEKYLIPGPLWWMLDPDFARSVQRSSTDPDMLGDNSDGSSVLLVDDVDDASDEFLRALIRLIGRREFWVPELGRRVAAPNSREFLVILGSTGDRQLHRDVRRSCVTVRATAPSIEELGVMAARHAPNLDAQAAAHVIAAVTRARQTLDLSPLLPSTAASFMQAVTQLQVDITNETHLIHAARVFGLLDYES